jgi:glutaredoxin
MDSTVSSPTTFIEPTANGYTIYTKPGCPYCVRVKNLLETHGVLTITLVQCEDYLLEARDEFLAFIAARAGKEYKTFPMVFEDGKFIGGFMDTKAHLDKKID